MVYPTMFETCTDFNRLIVPAGKYMKSERYHSMFNSPDIVAKSVKYDEPAGRRIPKPYQLNLADEVPKQIQKLKDDGLTLNEIKSQMQEYKQRKIQKYNNKTRIGEALHFEN